MTPIDLVFKTYKLFPSVFVLILFRLSRASFYITIFQYSIMTESTHLDPLSLCI